MKKVVARMLLAAAMVMSGLGAIYAQENAEDYYVKVVCQDGSQFDGYITSSLRNYFRPKVDKVKISKDFGGEPTEYTSQEVKAIIFPPNSSDSTTVVYEAVIAKLKSSAFSKAKPTKQPIFLRLIYQGENVNGYVMPVLDQTVTNTTHVKHYTYTYFFMPHDNPIAIGYWTDIDGNIPNVKGFMKKYMKEFPAIVRIIDDGELTPEAFRNNPAIVLPVMDATYVSH